MKEIIAYEKKLYFRDWKHYLISLLSHDDHCHLHKFASRRPRDQGAGNKLAALYFRRRKNDLGAKLGVIAYAGCCGKGLHIWHYGSVIISGDAKIGEDCTFHGQACIGNNGSSEAAPVIGNHVDIGVGARILGDIYIADHVKIGANAVVTKSCYEEGATLVGIPAQILKK